MLHKIETDPGLQREPAKNPGPLARLANIETDFSESLWLDGRLEESASVSREARVILSELLEAEPRNPMHTRGVIVALSYEADALETLGRYREAVEVRECPVSEIPCLRREERGRPPRSRHHDETTRRSAVSRRGDARGLSRARGKRWEPGSGLSPRVGSD